MIGIQVQVTGLSELQATLSKLPGVLQEKLGQQALSAAAALIQEEVRSRAPVRHGDKGSSSAKRITAGKAGAERFPGNLRQNIIRRRVKRQSGTIIRYEVGPSRKAWYGRLVETGSIYAAARPFMRPAVDARARDAIALFAERLARGMDQAVADAK